MRNTLLAVCVACLTGAGCDGETEREQELRELSAERQQLQAILDQNKTPVSQLTAEQRTYYGRVAQEIRAIDQQIDRELHPTYEWD